MGLRLPKWEDLTPDEQIPIANLPLNESYLVSGGPGTGKTIVALYRAKLLSTPTAAQESNTAADGAIEEDRKRILFLVYNRPLRMFLNEAILEYDLEEHAEAKTWHSWLHHIWGDHMQGDYPRFRPFSPIWSQVEPALVQHFNKIGCPYDHIILDEAQDFPSPLLRILAAAAPNLTVFADPNQAIYKEGTTNAAEISASLNLGEKKYHLSRNYRNTQQISEFCRLFYPGHSATLPAHSPRQGNLPTLMLTDDNERTIDYIATFCDNNPDKTIGLIVERASAQYYYDRLEDECQNTEIEIYKGGTDHGFSFDRSGVKILTHNTSKGLEFDAVIIPEFGSAYYICNGSDEQEIGRRLRNTYVAFSRARDELLVFSSRLVDSSPIHQKLLDNGDLFEVMEELD